MLHSNTRVWERVNNCKHPRNNVSFRDIYRSTLRIIAAINTIKQGPFSIFRSENRENIGMELNTLSQERIERRLKLYIIYLEFKVPGRGNVGAGVN